MNAMSEETDAQSRVYNLTPESRLAMHKLAGWLETSTFGGDATCNVCQDSKGLKAAAEPFVACFNLQTSVPIPSRGL